MVHARNATLLNKLYSNNTDAVSVTVVAVVWLLVVGLLQENQDKV